MVKHGLVRRWCFLSVAMTPTAWREGSSLDRVLFVVEIRISFTSNIPDGHTDSRQQPEADGQRRPAATRDRKEQQVFADCSASDWCELQQLETCFQLFTQTPGKASCP